MNQPMSNEVVHYSASLDDTHALSTTMPKTRLCQGFQTSPKCLSYTRCRSRMDHSCISSEILSTNQPHGILNIFGDTGSLNRPPACTRWKNRGHGTVNHSTVILIRPHDKEHPSGLANSISLACKHTDVGEAYTCRAYRFCHLLNASISDIWKEKEMWMCPEPRVLSQPDSRTQKKKRTMSSPQQNLTHSSLSMCFTISLVQLSFPFSTTTYQTTVARFNTRTYDAVGGITNLLTTPPNINFTDPPDSASKNQNHHHHLEWVTHLPRAPSHNNLNYG